MLALCLINLCVCVCVCVCVCCRYGGRVTSSISKKTSYIVVGEEAGESKLAKVSRK